jgi:hypothetical protein
MNKQIDDMLTRAVLGWRGTLVGIVLGTVQVLNAYKQAHGADRVSVTIAVLTALAGVLSKY